MMKFFTALGASAILAVGFSTSAQAAPVGGAQYESDNTCFIVWWLFVGLDCSYDGSRSGFADTWVGPIGLYTWGERLRVTGDMTVSGSGDGASISATLSMAGAERSGGCGQGGDCVEAWDSITHTIDATAVDRATANDAGGYTYEIAAKAFPPRLEPCVPYTIGPFGIYPNGPFGCNLGGMGWNFANQLYPSVTASPAFPAPGQAWQAPAPFGNSVSGMEGGRGNRNTGTTSSAVSTGYSCTTDGGDCEASSIMGPNPSYATVMMKVDTSAAGGIINAEVSVTHEYITVNPIFGDSWDGNWINMSGFVAERSGGPENQVDKKGVVPIIVYGAPGLDVRSIDSDSLELGTGLFYTAETYGDETHGKVHYGNFDRDEHEDLKLHFRSNESDLRCGQTETKLNGTSDGVPFSTTVTIVGIGKACAEE